MVEFIWIQMSERKSNRPSSPLNENRKRENDEQEHTGSSSSNSGL
jgi:hypothetical protein